MLFLTDKYNLINYLVCITYNLYLFLIPYWWKMKIERKWSRFIIYLFLRKMDSRG